MFKRVLLITMMLLASTVAPAQVGEGQKDDQGRQGIASWYGGNHHGRKTASGEKFNMYAMTAAHKKYPFGTKLRVTNVKNNKSVDVIVNDRGPYSKGRDLDLSKGAFQEIGSISRGILNVHIKVL